MGPLLLIILLALLAAFLYWQLVVAEGAYFGQRVVAALYDFVAHRYNAIKQYTAEDDARFLGEPLALSLQGIANPCVLDVATGTSRLPLALCLQPLFRGHVIALDNARRMLREATRYAGAYRDRIMWIWQHAVPLPFDDDAFDAVTCLEAFEFMPSTHNALAECIRVLKPGGLLLVSNRAGSGRKLMPGKTYNKEKFEALLHTLGQTDVTTQLWQYDYDLVWSLKPEASQACAEHTVTRQSGQDLSNPDADPLDLLRCPHCRGRLDRTMSDLICRVCARRYPIAADGVMEMLRYS